MDRTDGSVVSRRVAPRRLRVARRQPARPADRTRGAARLPRSPATLRDDGWRAARRQSGARRRRRRGWARGRFSDPETVPSSPGEPVSRDHALEGEPARAVRGGAEVLESDAVRLLVVSQQPVDRLGDHARAARAARTDVRAATFGRAHSRTAALQVAALEAQYR